MNMRKKVKVNIRIPTLAPIYNRCVVLVRITKPHQREIGVFEKQRLLRNGWSFCFFYVSRHCEARSNPDYTVQRHCGLDPQSPAYNAFNKGIPHQMRNDGVVGGNGTAFNSGLPRRSYLTARNDDVPFSFHISRFTFHISRFTFHKKNVPLQKIKTL